MKPSVKKRASSYQQIISGEWVSLKNGFDVACCSCGLVHGLTIRIQGGTPHLKFTVMPRATATYRRHHKQELTHHAKAKGKSRTRKIR